MLARDLRVGDERWSKGRRLSNDDLVRLADADFGDEITLLVLEAGEMHEDEAAIRLADAVAGKGLTRRGPVQSRIDLVAAHAGVLNVDVANLERINRIDPLEVFTAFDGQIVAKGDLVASVKVAPHVVPGVVVEQGARIAGFGSTPIVWVAPFIRSTVGVVVKESGSRQASGRRSKGSVRSWRRSATPTTMPISSSGRSIRLSRAASSSTSS